MTRPTSPGEAFAEGLREGLQPGSTAAARAARQHRRRQRAWRSAACCAALTAAVAFVELWVVTFDAYTWTEGSAWAFTMLAALLLALLCVYLEDRNRLLADELEVHRRD